MPCKRRRVPMPLGSERLKDIIGDISGDIKIFKPEMRDRIRAFLRAIHW